MDNNRRMMIGAVDKFMVVYTGGLANHTKFILSEAVESRDQQVEVKAKLELTTRAVKDSYSAGEIEWNLEDEDDAVEYATDLKNLMLALASKCQEVQA